MKTQVIKIGNSRGIRIPKSLLEQSGLGKEVDIEVREDELIVRSIDKPRKNWAEAFRTMAEQKDDALLDINNASLKNRWDKEEWDW
ncbi:MAG: AbrB/MazE/SpoVT family DNA-binding domain-containing protein [Ignavibacteriaceae bacterium]|jgi:antitoxin MazE